MVSSISLSNPELVKVDDSGRSTAYFCQKKPVRVDQSIIAELKEAAARIGDKNVRLCLHEGPDALFHEMIIFERRGKYYRPHKHEGRGDSFHIIEGSLGVCGFDEGGEVIDACRLEPGGNLIYRTGADMYHAVVPLSDFVIYHETNPGPFLGASSSLYPSWAPDGSNLEDAAKFTNHLLQVLASAS